MVTTATAPVSLTLGLTKALLQLGSLLLTCWTCPDTAHGLVGDDELPAEAHSGAVLGRRQCPCARPASMGLRMIFLSLCLVSLPLVLPLCLRLLNSVLLPL